MGDIVADIMEFEDGQMSAFQQIEFFAGLIRGGVVNHLQGSYGSNAAALINDGLISPDGEVLPAAYEYIFEEV